MTHATPFAFLRIVVLLTLAFRCTASDAVGLGPMRLQSALGQPLRASVQLLGSDARALADTCVRSRLTSSDGSEILRPNIELRRPANGSTEIFFSSPTSIEEPAVTLLVEIVCAPTLYRDYQLLLDLKDGLPRVLAKNGSESRAESRRRGSSKESRAINASADGNAGSNSGETPVKPKRNRKARVQPAVTNVGLGSGEPDNLQVLEEPAARRVQPKGLPGARNVLKLSQEDVSFGALPRKPSGLKLSDSLSVSEQPGIGNPEEIAASKARFAAMMRGEDPVLAAQNEIKALQSKVQQAQAQRGVVPAAPVAERPAAVPAEPPAPAAPAPVAARTKQTPQATFRDAPASNKWLIGLAVLLLAAIAIVSFFLRWSKRGTQNKNTPWWMSSTETSDRESELLIAARSSMDKKAVAPSMPLTEKETLAHQERTVESYVDRYVARDEQKTTPQEDPEAVNNNEVPVFEMPANPVKAAPEKASYLQADSMQDSEMLAPSRTNLATFELVSDVMQEAEFWKMLNETQRAIDILENYCSTDSAASPVPWLYLADLYRENRDGGRLEQLQQKFQQVFNGRFDEGDADADASFLSLEDYPHVIERISQLWGQEEVLGYLQSLLVNDRDVPRYGFHLRVYREILLLIEVALEKEKNFA